MYLSVARLRALFFLCLYTNSGLGAVEQKTILVDSEENAKLWISSTFGDRRDTVPIVNPINPSTTTPSVALGSPLPPTTPMSAPLNQVTTTPTMVGTSSTWCIAMPTASLTALQVALDYACGYGGANCAAIQQGASCYEPNTVHDHASYAFNDYYQKNPISTSCVFGGTAQVAYADPSHDSCHFASPTSTTTTTPVTPSPVIVSPPPPVYYSPTTTVPSPPITYGVAEPIESPSAATSIRRGSLIVLVATGFLGLVIVASGL